MPTVTAFQSRERVYRFCNKDDDVREKAQLITFQSRERVYRFCNILDRIEELYEQGLYDFNPANGSIVSATH